MSQLKPYSSFTTNSLAANFPALKLLFHADDIAAGATSWTCRKSGVVLTLQAAIAKDSAGIYTTVTNSVTTVTGTMPTLTGYAVAMQIGRLQTGSATTGLATNIGSITGVQMAATGLVRIGAGTAQNTAPTLTGTLDTGCLACACAYVDFVDTTSPLVVRAQGSGTSTNQVISNGTGTSDLIANAQFILGGALSSAMTIGALGANNDGRRSKIIALFDFGSPMTANDIQIATAEMARTQQLFAGWRNLAAA